MSYETTAERQKRERREARERAEKITLHNIIAAVSSSGLLVTLAALFPAWLPWVACLVLTVISGGLAWLGAAEQNEVLPRILWGIAGVAGVVILVGLIISGASPIVLVWHAITGVEIGRAHV